MQEIDPMVIVRGLAAMKDPTYDDQCCLFCSSIPPPGDMAEPHDQDCIYGMARRLLGLADWPEVNAYGRFG